MRTKILLTLALAVLVVAFMLPQRRDLASNINAYATLVPAIRANSAATGRIIDIANYGGVLMAVVGDSIDVSYPEAGLYVVLQDSLRTATDTAWTVVDSVLVDSANVSNAAANWIELSYIGRGRYLRAIQRATGDAADSIATAVLIVRGFCRAGPC